MEAVAIEEGSAHGDLAAERHGFDARIRQSLLDLSVDFAVESDAAAH